MKRAIILFTLTILFAMVSCEYDNYDPPSVGIEGTVTDEITGEPFQSEQPDGYEIRLLEEGYEDPVPIDFWGKADGTFEHSKLFTSQYKVVPINGAFFPADTVTVDVQKEGEEVNFTVMPFLALSASVDVTSDNDVIVTYTISREEEEDKIIERKSLASQLPTVSNTDFDHRVSHDLSEMDDEEIVDTQFSDTLTDLQSGETYYIRTAARTDNFLNRDNYSEIFEVEIP